MELKLEEFIQYAKERGCTITVKESADPDTFERIFDDLREPCKETE